MNSTYNMNTMKKPINYFAIILLSIFLLSSCSDDSTEFVQCPDVTVEEGTIAGDLEYEIIDAVISHLFGSFESVLIINAATNIVVGQNANEVQEYLDDREMDIDRVLIEEYINLNVEGGLWMNNFNNGELKSLAEKRCLFSNGHAGCEAYENKYPNATGFLSFTRPAVLGDNVAIIEFEVGYCTDVRSEFAVLKYENESWVVENIWVTTIS